MKAAIACILAFALLALCQANTVRFWPPVQPFMFCRATSAVSLMYATHHPTLSTPRASGVWGGRAGTASTFEADGWVEAALYQGRV